MPSLPNPDEFPYEPQEEDLPACVPACVAMVCAFLGIEHSWETIIEQLEFDPHTGTPFSNISNLAGVQAIPAFTLEEVEAHLSEPDPTPVIANLHAYDDEVLGYALDGFCPLHAVVIVAIDDFQVTFSDPLSHATLSTQAHSTCSRTVFEKAWQCGFALRPNPIGAF